MNSKKLIIFSVSIVALIAIGLIFLNKNPDNSNNLNSDQNISQPANESSALESINLTIISPYKGSGDATRNFHNGIFTHTVTADIDDPSPGKFYEGWLVKSGAFFSTGKLSKNDAGQWMLNYTINQNKLDYNKVVITEETEANGLDNKPEAHVLEGSF